MILLGFYKENSPILSGLVGFEVNDFLVSYLGRTGLLSILVFTIIFVLVVQWGLTPEKVVHFFKFLLKQETPSKEVPIENSLDMEIDAFVSESKEITDENDIHVDFISKDLSQYEAPAEIFEFCEGKNYKVDILVNNAGTALLENILSTSNEDWDKVQSVYLKIPFILAKLIAPNMIKQKSGKIVNISSVASEFALQDHIAYSVSKSGLNMLTKSMTVEWAKHNIQTNSVCPTIIMTTMGKLAWGDPQKSDPMLAKIPSGRFGEPREVANLVLFLCSPASNFISGQSIFIDGGFSVM